MEIREAEDKDIPVIVELLKLSLGESLMPKSEAFWRWKHVDNPFGKSPVLLAFEGDQLIGVRAFMRWEWKKGDKLYKAVRAVDTATHPEHQGKGIFKKLTLQLVEECRAGGVDFIFNSPNKISKPGYLKMGWMSNGRMKIQLKPVFFPKTKTSAFDESYSIHQRNSLWCDSFDSFRGSELMTRQSQTVLQWRYGGNPNIPYYAFSDHETDPTYLTIFRLKTNRFGMEFRICETFQTDRTDKRDYTKQLLRVVRASGAILVSAATGLNGFPTLTLKAGPEITTYPLSFDDNFLSFKFWKPTLGDMEVF